MSPFSKGECALFYEQSLVSSKLAKVLPRKYMLFVFHKTSKPFPRSERTVTSRCAEYNEKGVEESDVSIPPLNVHCVPLANLTSV